MTRKELEKKILAIELPGPEGNVKVFPEGLLTVERFLPKETIKEILLAVDEYTTNKIIEELEAVIKDINELPNEEFSDVIVGNIEDTIKALNHRKEE